MEELEIVKSILDSYPHSVVFVDNNYIIRFMNKRAKDRHNKEGKALIGQSISDCHNKESMERIKEYYEKLKKTGEDVLISINSKGQKIYMHGIKNEKEEWIGFIERFE